MAFKCTYCNREMFVSILEYKQNSTCNSCFDKRADEFVAKTQLVTNNFSYFGLLIDEFDEEDDTHHSIKNNQPINH